MVLHQDLINLDLKQKLSYVGGFFCDAAWTCQPRIDADRIA
jgi:hypothetical protein